jgi:serine phosphatase RsbU (regulator of sigma subunit)
MRMRRLWQFRRRVPVSEEVALVSAIFRLAFLLAFLIVAQIGESTRVVRLTATAEAVVVGASLYCLLVLIGYAHWGERPWMRPIVSLLDLALVTAFIAAVPGLGPRFFPIYFLLVVMAGTGMGLWGAVTVGALCCLSYAVATWVATPVYWIPPPLPTAQYDVPRLYRALEAVWPAVPWILLVAIASGMMAKAQERAMQHQQEMRAARRLQDMLLAKQLPATPGYDLGTSFRPASDVGGDYYDILALKGNRVGICVADVSGRGVVAALHLSLLKYAVHAAVRMHDDPADVAAHTNRTLYPHFASLEYEMFIGMFFAALDLPTGELTYVNAGHVPPFILRASARPQPSGAPEASGLEELSTGGLVLGVDENAAYPQRTTHLAPSDWLVCCTDGINGPVNRAGQELTAPDLAREIGAMPDPSAQAAADRLVEQGRAFARGATEDDSTALVIVRRDGEAAKASPALGNSRLKGELG